jgi:hypothetical protein
MKIAFGGGERARDHIIEYMKSDSCKKPRKITVRDHSRRMQALMKLANEAEGTESQLNEAKFNKILLNSFPNEWKTAFIVGGGNISTMSTEDLINHFSEVKIEYDNKDIKRRQGSMRNNYLNSGRGRGRGFYNPRYQGNNRYGRGRGHMNRNFNRGRGRGGQGPNPEIKCPLHPFSNHTWKKCFENQRGDQFRPYQARNNQQKTNGNIHFNQDMNDNDNRRNDQKSQMEQDDKSNENNSWKGIFHNR